MNMFEFFICVTICASITVIGCSAQPSNDPSIGSSKSTETKSIENNSDTVIANKDNNPETQEITDSPKISIECAKAISIAIDSLGGDPVYFKDNNQPPRWHLSTDIEKFESVTCNGLDSRKIGVLFRPKHPFERQHEHSDKEMNSLNPGVAMLFEIDVDTGRITTTEYR